MTHLRQNRPRTHADALVRPISGRKPRSIYDARTVRDYAACAVWILFCRKHAIAHSKPLCVAVCMNRVFGAPIGAPPAITRPFGENRNEFRCAHTSTANHLTYPVINVTHRRRMLHRLRSRRERLILWRLGCFPPCV